MDVSDVVSDGDGSLSHCMPKIKPQLSVWFQIPIT